MKIGRQERKLNQISKKKRSSQKNHSFNPPNFEGWEKPQREIKNDVHFGGSRTETKLNLKNKKVIAKKSQF